MSTTLRHLTVQERAYLAHAPVSGTEPVRLQDLAGLIPPATPAAVPWANITGRTAGVLAVVDPWLIDGEVIEWEEGLGTRQPVLRLAPSGGLTTGPAGLGVDLERVAPVDHTHWQFHDPLTVADTPSVALTLAGQALSAAVRRRPLGGLVEEADGLGVDFGTGANQVARGDHTHSGTGHPAATGATSNSLALVVDYTAQVIYGAVRRAANPPGGIEILETADGLYVPAGPSGTQAALGNHTHGTASLTQPGFLSAADYQLLRDLEAVSYIKRPETEAITTWHQEAPLDPSGTLPGIRQWSRPVRLRAATATARTGTIPGATQLGLFWEGMDTGKRLTLATGTAGQEVSATVSLLEVAVPPNTPLRWQVVSGPALSADQHRMADIALQYDMETEPAWRINCGGPTAYPWLAERLSAGASPTSTFSLVDTSGVSDPAPAALYQTCQGRVDGLPLVYSLTHLVGERLYRVRLHWADIGLGGSPGQCVMDVRLAGGTTETVDGVDVYLAAPGVNRAYLLERIVQAHEDGTLEVRLTPAPGTQRAFLNALEVLPYTPP